MMIIPSEELDFELNLAILKGDLDTVKRLVSQGVDINRRNEDKCGYTPLIKAILRGEKAIASYLISVGADTNAHTNLGISVTEIAQNQGMENIIPVVN